MNRATLALLALAVSTAHAQVTGTYTRNGTFGYGSLSNGTSFNDSQIGNFTYRHFSDGTSSTTNRIGAFDYTNYSNGVNATTNHIGNFGYTHDSAGGYGTSNTIGDVTYYHYTPGPSRNVAESAAQPSLVNSSFGQPIDYTINVPDPNDAARQNVATAAQILQFQQQQQLFALQQQADQARAETARLERENQEMLDSIQIGLMQRRQAQEEAERSANAAAEARRSREARLAASDREELVKKYNSMLLALVCKSKIYPARWDAKKFDGIARVAGALDGATGRLTSVWLVRSSGRRDVDQAALQSIVKAAPFPPFGEPGVMRFQTSLRYGPLRPTAAPAPVVSAEGLVPLMAQ